MAKRGEKSKSSDGNEGFVPVVVAGTLTEAELFRQLLQDHEIPTVLGTEDEFEALAQPVGEAVRVEEDSHGIPVLVPEQLLDEAGQVIAEREEFDSLAEEDEIPDDDEDEEFDLAEGLPVGWSEEEVEEDEDFVDDDEALDGSGDDDDL